MNINLNLTKTKENCLLSSLKKFLFIKIHKKWKKTLFLGLCSLLFFAITMGKLSCSAKMVNWMSRSLRAKVLSVGNKTFRVSIQSGQNQAFDNKVGTFYNNIDTVRFLHNVCFPGKSYCNIKIIGPLYNILYKRKNASSRIFPSFTYFVVNCLSK